MAWVLFAGVMAAIAGVIVSGFVAGCGDERMAHAGGACAGRCWKAMGGLAQGTLLATYCYWGYYNITYLGGEVKRPEKTIPRSILLSVLFVSRRSMSLMNLAALPSVAGCRGGRGGERCDRVQLVADIARSAFGGVGWIR